MQNAKKTGNLWMYQILGIVGTVIGYAVVTGGLPPITHAPVLGILGAIFGGAVVMTIVDAVRKTRED